MEKIIDLAYQVGPLLYMPADQVNIIDKIKNKSIKDLRSVAFCLEDTIEEGYLEEAEKKLLFIISSLKDVNDLPFIFIRVRTPQHLLKIHQMFKDYESIITGYILPKFDLSNCDAYIDIINKDLPKDIYIMPILESYDIADCAHRRDTLFIIKERINSISNRILNVRVGCNDLCNIFGVRRNSQQTIYDIHLVKDALIDILNVFSSEYVVSGPVYDYFDGGNNSNWAVTFNKEIELDISNGFIGKTCIHPTQLSYVIEKLKVNRIDYEDALSILKWNDAKRIVAKSVDGGRLNEVKCHTKWALKIAKLGAIYGIKDE